MKPIIIQPSKAHGITVRIELPNGDMRVRQFPRSQLIPALHYIQAVYEARNEPQKGKLTCQNLRRMFASFARDEASEDELFHGQYRNRVEGRQP